MNDLETWRNKIQDLIDKEKSQRDLIRQQLRDNQIKIQAYEQVIRAVCEDTAQ